MKIPAIISILLSAAWLNAAADIVVNVEPCEGDATAAISEAINKAAACKGKPVTIKFSPCTYDISREHSSRHLYHVSNTASVEENPDQTKHIGIWMRGMKNVTLDGDGAWIVTHGEMTPIVIDSCRNVTLKNFTLTAADPTVPEFKVLAVDRKSMTVEVTPPSRFAIGPEGRFSFVGEGWTVPDSKGNAIAQVFYPDINVTLRCDSPLDSYTSAQSLGGNIVRFNFTRTPDVHAGEYYQFRHSIRNEVCAFINRSADVTLRNVELNFIGNFGLVGQFSENLTYDNIRCRPRLGSGRTDAGFADFVQMSGCRGKIRIVNSHFEGAHDDPINIHGTHLKAVASDADNRLTVRFMHGQTYGFQPFYKGDDVEIVDRHTLNCIGEAKVRGVRKIDDYNYELTLDRKLPALPSGYTLDDLAVENVTWTPEVEIRNNYFARTPTRGILITTRGKSVIEDNVFFRIPMASVLVSDDARGWYESGPVRDLLIRRNLFIECGSPVILVKPETDRVDKPVHRNITVENNRFILRDGIVASISGAADVRITDNIIETPEAVEPSRLFEDSDVEGLIIRDNKVVTTNK